MTWAEVKSIGLRYSSVGEIAGHQHHEDLSEEVKEQDNATVWGGFCSNCFSKQIKSVPLSDWDN